jgi:hypothetical protein
LFPQEEEQEGKIARLEAELAERDKEVEHLKAAAVEEGQVPSSSCYNFVRVLQHF